MNGFDYYTTLLQFLALGFIAGGLVCGLLVAALVRRPS